jgi:hypothetical protein
MHLIALSHHTPNGEWASYSIDQKQNILRYVDKGWFSRAEVAAETGPFGLIAPGCESGYRMAVDIAGTIR